jgi:uncharacterized protein YdiU (UPF0061 family)
MRQCTQLHRNRYKKLKIDMNIQQTSQGLERLVFDNKFTRELPADPEQKNFRRQVEQACFSRVRPAVVSHPEKIACAREVAELIDLPEFECDSQRFADVFSGNALLDGMDPYAMCYGGHQFGNWAGQLGDGRAINLGEVINKKGDRWILQLKGAGPTPYSRDADGLAVLRSSVREFLCSEAMFHLGVPTTRALSLVSTGEQVMRDMFYDGNPTLEPGAVVCRVAPSFLRFGNFEILSSRGDTDTLRALLDYTLRTDFPHLGSPSQEVYLQWFEEVCSKTAEMVVHWQRVGFVHGVMNTDNMSVLGLTIDYGPYGWLEDYDSDWTPNTTDASGRRYRFGSQGQVAQWNLFMLAQAIYPLIDEPEPLQKALDSFARQYTSGWNTMMANKLGLSEYRPAGDDELIAELLNVLAQLETDMTIFYRRLTNISSATSPDASDSELIFPLQDAYYDPAQLDIEVSKKIAGWLRKYIHRLRKDAMDNTQRVQQMNSVNPKYVLRNYLAQLAIDKAHEGDYSMINELLELLRNPYAEQPANERFAEKRPDWARDRAGCSMLSCSS